MSLFFVLYCVFAVIIYDEEGKKRCSRCLNFKKVDEFFSEAGSKDGFRSACKQCEREKRRMAYSSPKKRAAQLRGNFKHRHGILISREASELILKSKSESCEICGRTAKQNGKALAVDHDHKTGKIRGCLCDKCNRFLGLCEDNLSILNAASEYLEKYHSKE